MFLLHKPSAPEIKAFITTQQGQPFSYRPVGMTRHPPIPGYTVDHYRIQLGVGSQAFQAARAALQQWKMFDLGWVQLSWPETPIEVGATVAVRVKHLGFWSLNACRIVYLSKESAQGESFGFAYGTLPAHGERGEERFQVMWNPEDGKVWYDVLAMSRPGFWAQWLYPYTRRLQKRFGADSQRAMLKAVREAGV